VAAPDLPHGPAHLRHVGAGARPAARARDEDNRA